MNDKYENLRNHDIDHKFSDLSTKHEKSNNRIEDILVRLSHIEGYHKGVDDTNKKVLDKVKWCIPIIISIVALYFSIFKK
ncbi:MAG: hypothetical protein ACI9CD_001153 [Candidatus Deianiraeaceae bacterium]|jgi:hypothetical protein